MKLSGFYFLSLIVAAVIPSESINDSIDKYDQNLDNDSQRVDEINNDSSNISFAAFSDSEEINYLINDINSFYNTPEGKSLLYNPSNNFHDKATGLNYKSRDGKIYEYEFENSKLTRRYDRDYIQGSCIDMTTSLSGGGLSHSLSGSFSGSIEGSFSFKFGLYFYSSNYGINFKAALSFSHSMSASCDVANGFGRLYVAYTKARLPNLIEQEMVEIDGRLVGTGKRTLIEIPEFYDEDSLIAECIISNDPC